MVPGCKRKRFPEWLKGQATGARTFEPNEKGGAQEMLFIALDKTAARVKNPSGKRLPDKLLVVLVPAWMRVLRCRTASGGVLRTPNR